MKKLRWYKRKLLKKKQKLNRLSPVLGIYFTVLICLILAICFSKPSFACQTCNVSRERNFPTFEMSFLLTTCPPVNDAMRWHTSGDFLSYLKPIVRSVGIRCHCCCLFSIHFLCFCCMGQVTTSGKPASFCSFVFVKHEENALVFAKNRRDIPEMFSVTSMKKKTSNFDLELVDFLLILSL